MPRQAKKSPEKPSVPTCPFSGNPLDFVQLSNGDWQVRGTGWVSAKLFPFREHAVWFFSHRDGKPPPGAIQTVTCSCSRPPAPGHPSR